MYDKWLSVLNFFFFSYETIRGTPSKYIPDRHIMCQPSQQHCLQFTDGCLGVAVTEKGPFNKSRQTLIGHCACSYQGVTPFFYIVVLWLLCCTVICLVIHLHVLSYVVVSHYCFFMNKWYKSLSPNHTNTLKMFIRMCFNYYACNDSNSLRDFNKFND